MSDEKTPQKAPVAKASSDELHTSSDSLDVGIRIKPVIIRLLLLVYLVCIVCLGYWYWMRPVRADQFKSAQEKWRAIAQIYHIPVPKDERWGW